MPTAAQIQAKIDDNNKMMQTASAYDKQRMANDNAKLQGMLSQPSSTPSQPSTPLPSSKPDNSGGISMTKVGQNGNEYGFSVVNDDWAKFYENQGAARVAQSPQYTYYTPPSNYGVDDQGKPRTEQQWLGGGGLLDLSGKNEVGAYKTNDGRYLDTSGLSAQQVHAASLWDDVKAGKRKAQDVAGVLKGQGIDAYGNSVSPYYQGSSVYYLPDYAPSLVPGTSQSGADAATALLNAAGGAAKSSGLSASPNSAAYGGGAAPAGGAAGTSSFGGAGGVSGQLTDSQKRAQEWINNPASGFGNLNEYVQTNIERFRRGDISYNALKADAERVGYGIPPLDGITGTQVPEPTLPDYSWITDMVNNELSTQKTAIEQELARMQQANELAVNQNNTFLQDSIKQLEENRITAGNEIANYQNRRGGFYSGGLDYQTGTNNAAFAEAEGSVTKDVQARNTDIWNRNALLAQQAAENLAKLQQQVPGRIQQLIQEQMEKDRQFALQEAGVTGTYNGQQTLAAQNQAFNQGVTTAQLGMQQDAQNLNEIQVMAALTGYLPDGTPTNAQQQQQLANLWAVADQTGRVPDALADLYGIQRGTSTLQAKQVAIAQQNANTSAYSSQTSRMNANQSQSKADQQQAVNTGMAQVIDGFSSFNTAADATAWLNKNASEITRELGADVYQELLKMIPYYFGPDTSGDQAASAQKIREQAISMAQRDDRWKYDNPGKEALIQEYIRMLTGS